MNKRSASKVAPGAGRPKTGNTGSPRVDPRIYPESAAVKEAQKKFKAEFNQRAAAIYRLLLAADRTDLLEGYMRSEEPLDSIAKKHPPKTKTSVSSAGPAQKSWEEAHASAAGRIQPGRHIVSE